MFADGDGGCFFLRIWWSTAPPGGGGSPAIGSPCLGLLDGAHVEGDLHLVAHQDATRFEGHVPGQAEVFAADGGLAGEADPLVAEGVGRESLEVHLELDRTRGATNREVARHDEVVAALVADAGGTESQL